MGVITVNADTTLTLPTFFGCSLRNINTELGFSNRATTYNISVVRDQGQSFSLESLDNDGIFSLQRIQIGKIDDWAFVSAWQETEVDIRGSGIFDVSLKDTREVVNAASLAVSNLPLASVEQEALGPNVVLVSGTTIQDVGNSILEHTFTYRGNSFQIDMGDVLDFVTKNILDQLPAETRGAGAALGGNSPPLTCPARPDRINFNRNLKSINVGGKGNTTSILIKPGTRGGLDITDGAGDEDATTSQQGSIGSFATQPGLRNVESFNFSEYIDSFLAAQGAEWYVKTTKSGNLFTIKIKVIERSVLSADEVGITVDQLEQLHNGKLISKKRGFEANPQSSAKTVVIGGRRRTLREINGTNFIQFWGFDADTGLPFENPTYIFKGIKTEIDIRTLDLALNNKLVSNSFPEDESIADLLGRSLTSEEINIIKRYASSHWGRTFSMELTGDDITDDDVALILPIAEGWFESDTIPNNQVDDMRDLYQKPDGRWRSFIKLPTINGSWFPNVQKSQGVFINKDDQVYMPVRAFVRGKFLILQTIVPLRASIRVDPTDLTFTEIRQTSFDTAWVALREESKHYGPWTNTGSTETINDLDGEVTVRSEDRFVPWMFKRQDLTNSEADRFMSELVLSTLGIFLSQKSVLKTAILVVADLPKKDIGDLITGGSAITQLSISIGVDRITTTYRISIFSRSELKEVEQRTARALNKLRESMQQLECDKDEDRNEDEIFDEIEPPDIDPEDIEEELQDQIDEIFEELKPPVNTWLWATERPKAGMGIITSKEDGPFYNINRVDQVITLSPFDTTGFKSKFFTEWKKVRNIAENDDSPGFLQNGERVEVTLYDTGQPVPRGTDPTPIGDAGSDFGGGTTHISTDDDTRKVPIISKTPTIFAIPPS